MTDKEIMERLIELKRKKHRREKLRDIAEGFIGFACLITICFMIAVIGG